MTITRVCKVVWSEWSVGGSRLSVHGKHPAARGRIGKQMGHREKHISVWSDIRRSLHPIRAAQEVQTDWDWWHQTAALQLWINEEKKTGQQNNKTTVSSPFLTHRERKMPSLFSFQRAALCVSRSCVCCCARRSTVCVVVRRRCKQGKAEGGEVRGREFLMASISSMLLSLCYRYTACVHSAVQCRRKQMTVKGASMRIIKLYVTNGWNHI